MNVKLILLFFFVSLSLRAEDVLTFNTQLSGNTFNVIEILRARAASVSTTDLLKASNSNYLKVKRDSTLSEIYFNNGDRVVIDKDLNSGNLININGIDGAILNNGRYIQREDLGEIFKYEGSINIGGINGLDIGSIYAASGGSESGGG